MSNFGRKPRFVKRTAYAAALYKTKRTARKPFWNSKRRKYTDPQRQAYWKKPVPGTGGRLQRATWWRPRWTRKKYDYHEQFADQLARYGNWGPVLDQEHISPAMEDDMYRAEYENYMDNQPINDWVDNDDDDPNAWAAAAAAQQWHAQHRN